jgi:hypothetical protein
MEPSKPERPSIWKEGLRVQDYVAMNVQVLNNPLFIFITMTIRPLFGLKGMHS